MYLLTESSLCVGLVSLAQLGPALVGSLLGGSLADAIDRRRMLVVTQVAQALCSCGLVVDSLGDTPSIGLLYGLVGCGAFFAGDDGPARMAIMINLVPRDQIPAANALRQLGGQASLVLGPALGGLLLARFSMPTVYWLDAGSFTAVIVASIGLPILVPEGSGTRFGLGSIVEGFRYLRGRQALQGIFLADLTAMILGMPLALFPALALSHFNGDAQVLGYMYAAPGVGALKRRDSRRGRPDGSARQRWCRRPGDSGHRCRSDDHGPPASDLGGGSGGAKWWPCTCVEG